MIPHAIPPLAQRPQRAILLLLWRSLQLPQHLPHALRVDPPIRAVQGPLAPQPARRVLLLPILALRRARTQRNVLAPKGIRGERRGLLEDGSDRSRLLRDELVAPATVEAAKFVVEIWIEVVGDGVARADCLAFAAALVGGLGAGRAGGVVEDRGLGSPEEPHSGSIHVILVRGGS